MKERRKPNVLTVRKVGNMMRAIANSGGWTETAAKYGENNVQLLWQWCSRDFETLPEAPDPEEIAEAAAYITTAQLSQNLTRVSFVQECPNSTFNTHAWLVKDFEKTNYIGTNCFNGFFVPGGSKTREEFFQKLVRAAMEHPDEVLAEGVPEGVRIIVEGVYYRQSKERYEACIQRGGEKDGEKEGR